MWDVVKRNVGHEGIDVRHEGIDVRHEEGTILVSNMWKF